MTNLKCGVETCGYNRDCCCCRSDITVEGTSAKCKDDTCCGNFKEMSGQSANKANTPNGDLHVSCDATTCIHNDCHKCSADHVDIAGSSACMCEQTLCSTFSAR